MNKNLAIQAVTLVLGMLLGVSLHSLYTIEKVRIDCTTQYLTTFGNINYMCYYVGTVEQRQAWLKAQGDVK